MKKITIAIVLLLLSTSFLQAQVYIIENFDAGTPAAWTDTYANTTTAPCSIQSERDNLWSSSTTGNMTTNNYVGISNGTDLSFSIDYKILNWSGLGATPSGWGSATLQYSTDDGTNWIDVLVIDDSNHIVSEECATLGAVVPASDLPTGSDVKLRVNNIWVGEDYYFYIDNFTATQYVACLPVSDLTATLTTGNSVDISWTANNSETQWEYVIQTQGTGEPTTAGIPTSTNPLTLSGLDSGTAYEVYIRAVCDAAEFSSWTAVSFTTSPACGDTIYDTGGVNGNYSNNENVILTIFPENPGDLVTFTFLFFNIENNFDNLYVYDGPDANSPLIATLTGDTLPDPIIASNTTGALTLNFTSDGSVTDFGYEILISCGPAPSCFAPTNLTATVSSATSAVIAWNANNGETEWEYVVQPVGSGIPTGSGTVTTSNPLTLTGLDSGTAYEVYIRAVCAPGDLSTWTGPVTFNTPVLTNYTIDCDSGQPLNLTYCYTDNDTTSFLFTSSNAFPLKIAFNSGNIEGFWDDLTIYDGVDNTGVVLFNNNDADINELAGLVFESTSTSIYMEIDSDGIISCDSSTTYTPWDFNVSCVTCITQTVDFGIVGSCEPDQEFFVEANVTDMGDAMNLEISDNFGSAIQTATSTGVVTMGPYTANSEVVVTVVNTDDTSCSVQSEILTFICPPPPNECSIVYAGEDTTFCSDNDPATTLTASYHIQGQDVSSYDISSIEDCPSPPLTGGIPTSINTDDVWSDVIDLGFEFCFFGETYNQVLIGSNGVLSFELENANGFNGWNIDPGDTLPNGTNTTLSQANIFGVAHDIDPGDCGEINYIVLGSYPARQFVVNYNDVCHFGFSCVDENGNDYTSTSQIILYESSNSIDINIIDKPLCTDWNDGLAVVGIQNVDNSIAFTAPERNTGAWATTNEFWRFSPSVGESDYVFEWYDGNTVIGTEDTITVYPEETTTYTAAVTYNLCGGGTATVTDTVLVEITPTPIPVAVEDQIALCDGEEQAILSVSVDPAQQVPDNVVYYWTYNNIDIVAGVSEANGGNTITLGGNNPEFDLLLGDYTVTAYNTVTECFASTVITVTQGTSPELEDGTSFMKCADGEVDLSVNITNDPEMSSNYLYDWYIEGVPILEGDTSGTFTHSQEFGFDSVLVVVTDTISNCSAETTITIDSFMNENCVDIPQGISPNGDDLNDCLVLDHLEAQEDIVKAEVYNRYGVKVFELNDYTDQWCGQDASGGSGSSGGLLPVGTYFYVIQFASDREPITSWIYLNY